MAKKSQESAPNPSSFASPSKDTFLMGEDLYNHVFAKKDLDLGSLTEEFERMDLVSEEDKKNEKKRPNEQDPQAAKGSASNKFFTNNGEYDYFN